MILVLFDGGSASWDDGSIDVIADDPLVEKARKLLKKTQEIRASYSGPDGLIGEAIERVASGPDHFRAAMLDMPGARVVIDD